VKGLEHENDGVGMAKRAMRICFWCDEYPPGPHGGIGTLIQLLARGMVQRGHRARVIGIYSQAYPARNYEEDEGVQVWRLREPDWRLGWLAARWRGYRMIADWSRHGEIDVIEVSDYGAPAAGWPGLPVPVIARLSGSASFFASEMGRPLHRRFHLEKASLRRADYWCSESHYLADRTRALFRLRTEPNAIIYNPVAIPAASSTEPRIAQRVVFAGTLTAKKGVLSLAKSWPLVVKAIPTAELHVWGKDTQTADGQSCLKQLREAFNGGTATSVRFHGHVPLQELLSVFESARVAVLPSYAEGFALTPMHAMAAGCPTIYTRRGSGPELIEDGQDGLLVDPDRPVEIAEAIVRILQDDELACRLGEAGHRRIVEGFSLSRLIPENERFYTDCVAAFGTGRAAVSRTASL
jgi:glycosyltransferase involved in cell wall biosynthesis